MIDIDSGWGKPFDHTYRYLVGWCEKIFKDAVRDKLERADRFLEESLEAHQAVYNECGEVFKGFQRAKRLADYVYSRPADSVHVELGGAFCTLMALYNVTHDGVSWTAIIDNEIERCESKDLYQFANKLNYKQNQGVSYFYMMPTLDESVSGLLHNVDVMNIRDLTHQVHAKTNYEFKSRLDNTI